ncbi:MAG: hypothetical protein EOO93_18720 [Pedobacter sp.]|nr:MAG: hypothetical protein EOO93_18720 [Pedobacter sp.]
MNKQTHSYIHTGDMPVNVTPVNNVPVNDMLVNNVPVNDIVAIDVKPTPVDVNIFDEIYSLQINELKDAAVNGSRVNKLMQQLRSRDQLILDRDLKIVNLTTENYTQRQKINELEIEFCSLEDSIRCERISCKALHSKNEARLAAEKLQNKTILETHISTINELRNEIKQLRSKLHEINTKITLHYR